MRILWDTLRVYMEIPLLLQGYGEIENSPLHI